MTVKALKLNLSETIAVFVENLGDLAQSRIPNSKKLEKVLARMHKQMLELRQSYRDSLAQVNLYHNEGKNTGLIPELESKLASYDEQGRIWTDEQKAIEADSPDTYKRRTDWRRLEQQLNALDEKMAADERSLANYRSILSTNKETLAIREGHYTKAKTSYENLKNYGPAIVKQMEAKKAAMAENDEARQEKVVLNDSTAILNELQSEMDLVDAEYDAELQISDEEEPFDIDAVIANEAAEAHRSERRNRWAQN